MHFAVEVVEVGGSLSPCDKTIRAEGLTLHQSFCFSDKVLHTLLIDMIPESGGSARMPKFLQLPMLAEVQETSESLPP